MSLTFRKEVINLKKNLDKFATEGLRTLVLGVRKIGKGEWESWKAKYEQASNLILKREETMRALQAEIEVNLYIIGATAIEDRLQDEVRKLSLLRPLPLPPLITAF